MKQKHSHILLVEDDFSFAKLLQFRLEKEGYQLTLAKNGAEALDCIDAQRPDLILTDILMPYINGLELVSKINEDLKLHIPFIVFSAAGQEQMVMRAFEMGAIDFMRKPFSPNELIIRIKHLFHGKALSTNSIGSAQKTDEPDKPDPLIDSYETRIQELQRKLEAMEKSNPRHS